MNTRLGNLKMEIVLLLSCLNAFKQLIFLTQSRCMSRKKIKLTHQAINVALLTYLPVSSHLHTYVFFKKLLSFSLFYNLLPTNTPFNYNVFCVYTCKDLAF